MIIPNKFIKLEYDPATDILFVEWPNIHDFSLAELKFILSELISSIKNYDIKKVLADSTKSTITMADAEYNKVVEQLAKDLLTTRVEKFARVSTGLGNREKAAQNAAKIVEEKFSIKNFTYKEDALAWLNS